jgi:putative xylitol transport system substrate-binding protein
MKTRQTFSEQSRTELQLAIRMKMKTQKHTMINHSNSKSLISLLVCCALALLAASTQAADKLRVGGAVYGLKAEFANLWAAALKKHPAVKDGSVEVTIFDGRYDPMVQNNQIATMMTQRFDGIVLSPVDYNGSAPQIKKAAKAGIPVVVSNARVNSPDITSMVLSDDVKAGEIIMEEAAKRMGGKGNVVIFQGPIGHSAEIDRSKGIQNVLEKYPDIKVLEKKTANWSRAEGLSLMENWLTAHPNEIKGVIGENDEMALGALQAIKGRGLNVKDFVVVGIDGVPDAINAVKQGEMFSILQDAEGQAAGALDVVLRAKIGESYQPKAAVWKQWEKEMPWNDGKEKAYFIPWTTITAENADDLIKHQKQLISGS